MPPYRQPADVARSGDRRGRAGPWRRLHGEPRLRRKRAVIDRQLGRLPDPHAATDFPRIRATAFEDHPLPSNPLWVKGAGEGAPNGRAVPSARRAKSSGWPAAAAKAVEYVSTRFLAQQLFDEAVSDDHQCIEDRVDRRGSGIWAIEAKPTARICSDNSHADLVSVKHEIPLLIGSMFPGRSQGQAKPITGLRLRFGIRYFRSGRGWHGWGGDYSPLKSGVGPAAARRRFASA